jgi:hypothetical protein
LRPKRTGTSHCWPALRRRHKVNCHWLVVLRFCHILGRSCSEQKCTFGALPRPGRQTYCAVVKVDNGGDGHFQAEAAVRCLTSFGGFLPDQPQTQSSTFCKHYQHWHVAEFPTGGMSICTPGFSTPLACNKITRHAVAQLVDAYATAMMTSTRVVLAGETVYEKLWPSIDELSSCYSVHHYYYSVYLWHEKGSSRRFPIARYVS